MGNNFDGPILLDQQTEYLGFGRADEATISINYGSKANGGFAATDTVTGATSGATGTVVSVKDNGAANTGTIYLKSVTGTFLSGENLQVSGTTRGAATAGPAAYTGAATHAKILYLEASPNGVVTAPQGSIALVGSVAQLWQNTDGGTTWAQRT